MDNSKPIPCHTCKHAHYLHDNDQTEVCKVSGCMCMGFVYKINNPKIDTFGSYMEYLQKYDEVKERVKTILEDVPDARNLENKEFVYLYLHYVFGLVISPRLRRELDDFETIRRTHQKLVEEDSEKYGPTDPEFIKQKGIKEVATQEFVTFRSR